MIGFGDVVCFTGESIVYSRSLLSGSNREMVAGSQRLSLIHVIFLFHFGEMMSTGFIESG